VVTWLKPGVNAKEKYFLGDVSCGCAFAARDDRKSRVNLRLVWLEKLAWLKPPRLSKAAALPDTEMAPTRSRTVLRSGDADDAHFLVSPVELMASLLLLTGKITEWRLIVRPGLERALFPVPLQGSLSKESLVPFVMTDKKILVGIKDPQITQIVQ
jgi:hypothetical protein